MSKQPITTNQKLEASGLLTHPEVYSVPDGIQRMIFTGTGAPIGKSSIYSLINSGQLKARKLGNRTIVLRVDFLDFLKSLPEFGDPLATKSLAKMSIKAHPDIK